MRLARIGAKAQRVSRLDLDLTRHHDAEVAAKRRSGVDECLSAHWLDQLRAACDRVGASGALRDKRAGPDADCDLSLWESLHRRIDCKPNRLAVYGEPAVRSLDAIELGSKKVHLRRPYETRDEECGRPPKNFVGRGDLLDDAAAHHRV